MDVRVLIGYATKHGGTEEIARRIGEVLLEAGIDANVVPVDRLSGPISYDAVILGSAVYAGQWRKEAAQFFEAHEEELAELPAWLFSSGPTGEEDPVEAMDGWRFPEKLRPLANRIGPRDIAFFHGVLDMKKLNLPEKLVVRALKAPVGDFRDWDAITSWARQIAAALQPE